MWHQSYSSLRSLSFYQVTSDTSCALYIAHQSDQNMPHLKFANGIQNYSNLQAHKTTGVLLLIVISLHCKIGWDQNSTASSTKNFFIHSCLCNKCPHVIEYQDLFEMLLCMEQWLKLPSIRKANVTPNGGSFSDSTAKSALWIAIKKFVKTVNHSEGYGMKLIKYTVSFTYLMMLPCLVLGRIGTLVHPNLITRRM